MSATKDTKDIDLASLRVLLVADGANPCEYLRIVILCMNRSTQGHSLRATLSQTNLAVRAIYAQTLCVHVLARVRVSHWQYVDRVVDKTAQAADVVSCRCQRLVTA